MGRVDHRKKLWNVPVYWQVQVVVKINVIDQRKNENNLKKAENTFFKNNGNRFLFPQKQSTGNHKENRNGRFYPKRNRHIQRKKERVRPGKINGKSGGGRMGKHNKPNTQKTQQLNMKFFCRCVIHGWRRHNNIPSCFLLWYHEYKKIIKSDCLISNAERKYG